MCAGERRAVPRRKSSKQRLEGLHAIKSSQLPGFPMRMLGTVLFACPCLRLSLQGQFPRALIGYHVSSLLQACHSPQTKGQH